MRLNPRVTGDFTGDGARNLHALEEETGRRFFFEGSEGLPLDHFAITQEGTREEVETQAVPFPEGDEVHVHIVEPHMYNVDDAVAKIDGYMIEVVNAIPYVGEKRLVRIEEAGRTGAPRRARRRRGRGGRRRWPSPAPRPPRSAPAGGRGPPPRRRRSAAAEAARRRPSRKPEDGARGGRRATAPGTATTNARIEASAPRPQRRTAPFACQGRSQRVSADTMPRDHYRLRRHQDRRQAVPRRGGQTLLVERLPDDEGAKIALEPLLYSGGKDTLFESADLGRVKVEAKILGHERGPKLRVFKFKPKRGYKRTTGHRQELTRLEVTGITRRPRLVGIEEEDGRGGREWLIRRASAPAATAATPTPSASA